MTKGKVYAISGIDTDIGKTVFTGLLARGLLQQGKKVITAKAVQTGCEGVSEDIIYHRKITGQSLLPEDIAGTTCPYIYKIPCSPHLAASLEKDEIEPARIADCIDQLRNHYDIVLLEGAGGLFVPLTMDLLMIDFFRQQNWPVILVSSARLGSLNHTLANIEALKQRDMELSGIVYNLYGQPDSRIRQDSLRVIKDYSRRYNYFCPVVEMEDESVYENQRMATKLVDFVGSMK
jgi:dethiobiotin synthetase